MAIIFLAVAFGGWQYSWTAWGLRGPIPVTQQQRDQYLAQRLPSYPAHQVLKSISGPKYTLYAMQDENMAYFVDGTYMGDYFGPARYDRIWRTLTDGQSLYNELKTMNVDYFLVNDIRQKIQLPQDDFFRTHFKPLYDTANVHLFEVTAVPFTLKLRNLIENPDFEEFQNKTVARWHFAGSPIVDASGKQSFKGHASMRCNRSGDVLYQTLSINAGKNYIFSCESRAVTHSGTVKLQANWYDKQGSLLKEVVKVCEVGTNWTRCETTFEAPAHAISVTTYASPLDPGAVWFDDFSFGIISYEPLP